MREHGKTGGNAVAGYVVGIGAANMDVHGRSINSIKLRDSNPGRLSMSAGGVTRNILENLSRLDINTHLISAVGTDAFGHGIVESCKRANIGTEHLLLLNGESSSSYIAMLDDSGDMLLGMSDMRILKRLTPEHIQKNAEFIANADMVVIDGCLSEATIEAILDAAKGIRVAADPVSTAYARTIAEFSHRLYLIKPNLMELEVLSGMRAQSDEEIIASAAKLIEAGTFSVAVSLGARGCYYADATGKSFFGSFKAVEAMANATGAGDAFMAGLISGIVRGKSAERCVERALAAGIAAITSQNTINEGMSEALLTDITEKYSYGGNIIWN